MQPSDWISLNKNSWTNNKLYINYLKDWLELTTRAKLQGKYRLLIIDWHTSYVSNRFIKFIKANKIIILYLPSHLIHLL